MADDVAPILPDESALAARARAAGVNLDALDYLARIRRLREFYTPDERAALEAMNRAEIAEDAKRYNAYVERYGIWNSKIRGW